MTVAGTDGTGAGARLLDGRVTARAVLDGVASGVAAHAALTGRAPGLAIVQIGRDPAAASYVQAIVRTCQRAGIVPEVRDLPAGVSPDALASTLDRLAGDPATSGIIVQMPLPPSLLAVVRAHLPAIKDVDGIHPLNVGLVTLGDPAGYVPATPLGGMLLLQRYGIALEGRRAVVIGRSPVVGRPMALLLMHAHATVTVCHSRTPDLAEIARTADVLAVAAGRPALVTADMVRPGAVVLDFGVNASGDRMVGDVDTEGVSRVAGWITPVPGGTGPMTNAALVQNTLRAAQRQAA
jgi:methylenetetrahydrofolate dehydrogenase (NADP+)/methenyltetrahydrofolate cyclohydrolase